jgi:hypothetical protein
MEPANLTTVMKNTTGTITETYGTIKLGIQRTSPRKPTSSTSSKRSP